VHCDFMQIHDAIQRRCRYAPSTTGKRVTLKTRDRQWLELIARHGPLPSQYLHAATEASHPNAKASRMRLMDLASEANTPHGGAYLVRPPMQRAIENARNRSLIYDLSKCGWAALEKSRSDVVRANGPFRHQVMVACVTASIEIACLGRDDVAYIPADQFLPAADRLGVDLELTNPSIGRTERHRLMPDQLFALAYRSNGKTSYRAYSVECDRATEPVTSPSMARKSYVRSYLQYREFVGHGLYKEQYGLKCPMMVLNIMTSPTRQERFQKLVLQCSPQGNAYMLFRTLEEFSTAISPTSVLSGFLTESWERAGQSTMPLYPN
jgi:hypothetical protein